MTKPCPACTSPLISAQKAAAFSTSKAATALSSTALASRKPLSPTATKSALAPRSLSFAWCATNRSPQKLPSRNQSPTQYLTQSPPSHLSREQRNHLHHMLRLPPLQLPSSLASFPLSRFALRNSCLRQSRRRQNLFRRSRRNLVSRIFLRKSCSRSTPCSTPRANPAF